MFYSKHTHLWGREYETQDLFQVHLTIVRYLLCFVPISDLNQPSICISQKLERHPYRGIKTLISQHQRVGEKMQELNDMLK